MNHFRQRQQQQIQQANHPTTSDVSFSIIKGIFILLMIGFFALFILSIIVLISNKNQSQILIMCLLIMLLSIGIIFSFLYFYLQISTVQENVEKQKNDELFLNQTIFQSTRDFFVAYSGLSKFYIIRYQYIYSTLAILLMILKILPTTKKYCKDHIDGNYYEVDKNEIEPDYHYDCFSVQLKPLYEGPMLNILGFLSGILILITWFIELSRLQRYFLRCCRVNYQLKDYVLSSQNLDQQQTIKTVNIFLFISISYSILKIIILAVIAILDENETSLILICSNIYFHLIMFLINLRIYLLIKEDIQENKLLQNMNDSQNYMTLITYKFSPKNNSNKIFYFFNLLSLPFCVAGGIMHTKRYNEFEIINFDHFVFFDCLIMQIIAIVLIIIIFYIKPCLSYTNGNAPYIHQVGQEINNRNEQQQLQPLNNLNQQPQYMMQNQVVQNENIELNTQANQRQVYLPPIQYQQSKSPYVYNIKISKQTDCTICLQLMTNDPGNQIVQLTCHKTHIFHYKCIHEWLQNHKQCPLCNAQF